MSNDTPYFVDANGNTVEEGSAAAKFRVNPADPTSGGFVQSLKDGTNALSATALAGGVVHSTAADVQPAKHQPMIVDDAKSAAAPVKGDSKPGK